MAPKITEWMHFEQGNEYDFDSRREAFVSVEDAIDTIREGKMVILIDDYEGKGYLVMAASLATTEAMAFMQKHSSRVVCVGNKEEDLKRFKLPLMETPVDLELKLCSPLVILDAAHATTSDDLACLGYTEAAIHLIILAGLDPVAVVSEVVETDGSSSKLTDLYKLAYDGNLTFIAISDLIRHMRKKNVLLELIAITPIPTRWGLFNAHCYKSLQDEMEQIAMVKGEIGDGKDVLVRVHSECFTGDIFGSARCDCGNQLAFAMEEIEASGRGVVVYLRGHEGRGIGLGNKLRAYNLQDDGRDTVEANEELGLPVDSRDYATGAQMLRDIGVRTIKLMTNNPTKCAALKGYGLEIACRVPVLTPITTENKRYLETKRAKMGHMYDSECDNLTNSGPSPDLSDE